MSRRLWAPRGRSVYNKIKMSREKSRKINDEYYGKHVGGKVALTKCFSISHWYFPRQYVTCEALYFKPILRSKHENKAKQSKVNLHYNGRMVSMDGDKNYQHRNHPTIYGVISNSSLSKKNKRWKLIENKTGTRMSKSSCGANWGQDMSGTGYCSPIRGVWSIKTSQTMHRIYLLRISWKL